MQVVNCQSDNVLLTFTKIRAAVVENKSSLYDHYITQAFEMHLALSDPESKTVSP